MSDKNVEKSKSCDDQSIQKLPLEIVSKIVKHLSLDDIHSLLSVSKIWRCNYLNQDFVWMNICKNFNLEKEDYTNCLIDVALRNKIPKKKNGVPKIHDGLSEHFFGPFCIWWTVWNRYNMVLRNIKNRNFPIVTLLREEPSVRSFYSDDYIVNIYPSRKVDVNILKGSVGRVTTFALEINDALQKLFMNQDYVPNIIGNRNFLVFEIGTFIIVYKINNGKFEFHYSKIVGKSDDNKFEPLNTIPQKEFLKKINCTKIDINGNKLAICQEFLNTAYTVDLEDGKTTRELKFCKKFCVIDSMKYTDDKLMIGVTIKEKCSDNRYYYAIIYRLEEKANNRLKVPLFGAVTRFKLTKKVIGVENAASQTPFITKNGKYIRIFWLDCDSFSFDSTRQFIYYNVNKSIYQYDLHKALYNNFEVTQKIAIDVMSSHFSLTPINDRFLLIRSISPYTYDIFDVVKHVFVKSIQLSAGYTLNHVGKLSVVFSNSKQFIIVPFC